MKYCSKCHSAGYCSSECQLADWKAGHKQACPKLVAAKLSILSKKKQKFNSKVALTYLRSTSGELRRLSSVQKVHLNKSVVVADFVSLKVKRRVTIYPLDLFFDTVIQQPLFVENAATLIEYRKMLTNTETGYFGLVLLPNCMSMTLVESIHNRQ